MKQLYAYYRRILQILLIVPALFTLQGCVTEAPYSSPWVLEQPANTDRAREGIGDDLAPIIGWQKQEDNVARAQQAEQRQPQPGQQDAVDDQTQDMLKRYAGDSDNRTSGRQVYVLSSRDNANKLAYENDPSTYADNYSKMQRYQQKQQYRRQASGVDDYVDDAIDETAVAPADRRRVVVSILLPLSGQHAALGKAMLNAAQMAMFDIGVEKFELVPRDTQGTPAGAQRAAQEAISEGAELIVGPLFSESLRAVKPVAEQSRVTVVSFTTDWRLAGGNTYVMGFMPFAQVARVTNYALSKGYSRFAVLGPQNDYSDIVIRTLHHALERHGMQIVDTRRYAAMQNQNDLKDIVGDFVGGKDNAANLHFDALMLPVGGEGLRTVVTMLSYFDIDRNAARFIGTGLWDDPSLAKEPGLEGAWFAAPDPGPRMDFEKRYADTYGSRPPRLATLSYDATALAAVLVQRYNGHGRIFSRPDMTAPRGYAGIDGIFRFRPDGLVERGLAVLEVKRTGLEVIDPAPAAFTSARGM